MPYVTRKIPLCSHCGHEWWPKPNKQGIRKKPKRCAKCKDPNWDKPRLRASNNVYERFCIDPACGHKLARHPLGMRGCIMPGCKCQQAPNLRMSDIELAQYLDAQFPRTRVERKAKKGK